MTKINRGDFLLAFLVRHGQAAVPDQDGRYFSKGYSPLTAVGEQQALNVGAFLHGVGIDTIWASDLPRARQTAEIIADTVDVPARYDPRLQEVDSGELDGSRLTDLEKHHPRFLPWIRAGFQQGFGADSNGHLDANLQFPGGESVAEAGARSVAAFRDIAAAHMGGVVCLVSHAWVTASILCHVLTLPVAQYHRFGMPNAGVSLVRVGRDGRGMLDALNLAVPLDALAGGSLPLREQPTSVLGE